MVGSILDGRILYHLGREGELAGGSQHKDLQRVDGNGRGSGESELALLQTQRGLDLCVVGRHLDCAGGGIWGVCMHVCMCGGVWCARLRVCVEGCGVHACVSVWRGVVCTFACLCGGACCADLAVYELRGKSVIRRELALWSRWRGRKPE